MFFSRFSALAMLATSALAKEVAIYWGQNDSERDLAAYCQAGEGINILILSFLGNFGNGIYPNGNLGNCYVNSDQSFSGCEQLASDISTCQEAGIKIFLSLGGYFSSDTSRSYYISGAPQCVAPDANMGLAISQAQFDYLFIQFYNNPCSAGDLFENSQNNPNGMGGSFNFDVWPGTISGGASASAALHVGLAAAADAASAYDYVQPSNLPTLLSNASSVAGFNGFMLYDAGASDELSDNGCNYAQEVTSVLNTGNTC